MFGYIRPFREELKVRDFDRYQALYCGMCHTIRARYGRIARMFLNYDLTFLAMVLSDGAVPQVQKRRCVISPVKGKPACAPDNAIETAADATVILAYWKLKDNVADSGFWKGLSARFLEWSLYRAYRKAARIRPAFDYCVRSCLEELRTLEEENCASLDRAADTFARILKAAAPGSGDAARDRVAEQILYHTGRWIYLLDAWNDLEEDRRDLNYNPILVRFEGAPETALDTLKTTLRHSLNLAASAYHLGEFGCYGAILGNIIFLGLPMVEELVLSGQWKQAQKLLSGGRNNNRRE